MRGLTRREKSVYVYAYLFNTYESNKNITVDEFLRMVDGVCDLVGLVCNDELINRMIDFHEQLQDVMGIDRTNK